jgi:hypothetical protein
VPSFGILRKKSRKRSAPPGTRSGWPTDKPFQSLTASRKRRDDVRSANLYGFFDVRACWAANRNLRHSGVEQLGDLFVAGIRVARSNEGVDHVIIH